MLMLFFLHAHENQKKKKKDFPILYLSFAFLSLLTVLWMVSLQRVSHEYSFSLHGARKANRFVRGSERSHTRHGISLLALSMAEPQDLNEAIICIDSPQENKLCQGLFISTYHFVWTAYLCAGARKGKRAPAEIKQNLHFMRSLALFACNLDT